MKWPFVVSIPHCGQKVPDYILRLIRLDWQQIMESVDIGTKEIFGGLPVHKTVMAKWSRLVVDLNRAPSDMSDRGVVARVDYHGRRVYRENVVINTQEVNRRIREYYLPYHQQLNKAIASPEVIGLFDCHSLEPIAPPGAPDAGRPRADIILGNNGSSVRGSDGPKVTCSTRFLQLITSILSKEGFSVSLNYPYSGGFITTFYGQDLRKRGGFALQVEINQSLLFKHGQKTPDPDLERSVKARIWNVFEQVAMSLR